MISQSITGNGEVEYEFSEKTSNYIKNQAAKALKIDRGNNVGPDDFKEPVGLFLTVLQQYCTWLLSLNEPPARDDGREMLGEMHACFMAAKNYLTKIADKNIAIPLPRIPSTPAWKSSREETHRQATKYLEMRYQADQGVLYAEKACRNLSLLCGILEKNLAGKKKDSPTKHATVFAKNVAELYLFCFKTMPTAAPDGPYVSILNKSFEVTGFDCNQSCQVAKIAVRELRERNP